VLYFKNIVIRYVSQEQPNVLKRELKNMSYDKEFKLVFQYDVEQAGNRFSAKRIERMATASGAELLDIFEDYGLKEVDLRFQGNLESAQKIVNEVLQASFKNNVKIGGAITQQCPFFSIDKKNVTDLSAFEETTHNFWFEHGGCKIIEDEFNSNILNIRLINHEQFSQNKDAYEQKVAGYLNGVQFNTGVEHSNVFDTNNYTESNKRRFSY
jgi:hypothetical protein